MDNDADLPLALYKARLALSLQLIELMLSARQRWLALGVDLLADDIARVQTAYAELMGTTDWVAMATLWPDAWWRASRHGVTVLEGLTHTALDNHSAFVTQTQQAVGQWQQAVVQALHAAGNTMPFHGLLQNALMAFTPVRASAPSQQANEGGAGTRGAAKVGS